MPIAPMCRIRFAAMLLSPGLALCACSGGLLGQQPSPVGGSIEGTVLDQEGKPVAVARVNLEPIPKPLRFSPSSARTDGKGRFGLAGLPAGRYEVLAAKEAAGFPELAIPFFAVGSPAPPQVQIEEDRVTRGVEVRVGRPLGRVRATVRDARDERPIAPVYYHLTLVENPNIWVESGGDLEGELDTLVPPVSRRMEVTAPGYQLWRSEDMVVTSGTVKEFLIRLSPVKEQSPEKKK